MLNDLYFCFNVDLINQLSQNESIKNKISISFIKNGHTDMKLRMMQLNH